MKKNVSRKNEVLLKNLIFLISIFVSFELIAQTCSKNGANVIFINGILGETDELDNLTKYIKNQFSEKELDQTSISYNLQMNKSYSALSDIAEMYYLKNKVNTGRDDGFERFFATYQSRISSLKKGPGLFEKLEGALTNSPSLNKWKLINSRKDKLEALLLEKQGNLKVISNGELQTAANEVVESLKNKISSNLDQNKKIILIPHSSGNAVVNKALTDFKNQGNLVFDQKLSSTVGMLAVASPIVYKNNYNLLNFKRYSFSNDVVLALSSKFFPEFSQYPSTHTIFPGFSEQDPFNHGMLESYLSSDRSANVEGVKAKENFKNLLRAVANDLPSNCNPPKAVITYDGNPSDYETSFTKKYRFYANESLLYDDKPDSKGSFKIYKWKILKKEVVDFDEGHTDLVLASKTLGRDITFTKEGPENFFDVTIENYQEFTVSLEVVREDGGSNYTEFRFWPKLMDAKYSSSRITYCYKMDKRGTPAFYMDVIISGNNHQGTTFYLYWETNDQPSDYFGINVTDTYLGLRNVWGVYGDNLTFRLTKRVNFVSQDMIELGSYPVPVCRP